MIKFEDYNPKIRLFKPTENLYGIVYYFHRGEIDSDADNISKPVWDCLQDILYENDLQIKLRFAGTYAFSDYDFYALSESIQNSQLFPVFEHLFEFSDNFIYIECG